MHMNHCWFMELLKEIGNKKFGDLIFLASACWLSNRKVLQRLMILLMPIFFKQNECLPNTHQRKTRLHIIYNFSLILYFSYEQLNLKVSGKEKLA